MLIMYVGEGKVGRKVRRYFIKYIAAYAELRIYIMVIIYTNNFKIE